MAAERVAQPVPNPAPIGVLRDVIYLIPDDTPDSRAITFSTAVIMADQSNCWQENCSAYLSAISLMLPVSEEVIKNALHEVGLRQDKVKIPTDSLTRFIEIQPPDSYPRNLYTFGLLILVLYKKINQINYDAYMADRGEALAAYVGLPIDVTMIKPLDVAAAERINRTLGARFELRKVVLQCILSSLNQQNMLGKVCTYLAGILEWTELSYLSFIFETLVMTKSPVLRLPKLATEVKNFTGAIRAVTSFEYPQYFKFLSPPASQRVIERNRFPTLMAVAQKIMSERPPVRQLDEALVVEYYEIHRRAMRERERLPDAMASRQV